MPMLSNVKLESDSLDIEEARFNNDNVNKPLITQDGVKKTLNVDKEIEIASFRHNSGTNIT